MKERREKGFCYNCDEKWGLGHMCKAAKLFIMEGEESEDELKPTRRNQVNDEGSLKNELEIVEVEPRICILAL